MWAVQLSAGGVPACSDRGTAPRRGGQSLALLSPEWGAPLPVCSMQKVRSAGASSTQKENAHGARQVRGGRATSDALASPPSAHFSHRKGAETNPTDCGAPRFVSNFCQKRTAMLRTTTSRLIFDNKGTASKDAPEKLACLINVKDNTAARRKTPNQLQPEEAAACCRQLTAPRCSATLRTTRIQKVPRATHTAAASQDPPLLVVEGGEQSSAAWNAKKNPPRPRRGSAAYAYEATPAGSCENLPGN
eukprot:g11786.t1